MVMVMNLQIQQTEGHLQTRKKMGHIERLGQVGISVHKVSKGGRGS